MFVLKKKNLDVVLGHYPQIKKKILETAEERQRMVAERAAAFAKKKKEEDDAKKAAEDGVSQDGPGVEKENDSAESQVCLSSDIYKWIFFTNKFFMS